MSAPAETSPVCRHLAIASFCPECVLDAVRAAGGPAPPSDPEPRWPPPADTSARSFAAMLRCMYDRESRRALEQQIARVALYAADAPVEQCGKATAKQCNQQALGPAMAHVIGWHAANGTDPAKCLRGMTAGAAYAPLLLALADEIDAMRTRAS